MDAHVLGRPEVFRTAENGSRYALAVDFSREGDPVRTRVIALPAPFTIAGQVLQVARIDTAITLLFQPLFVAAERHAAVVVLRQTQWRV